MTALEDGSARERRALEKFAYYDRMKWDAAARQMKAIDSKLCSLKAVLVSIALLKFVAVCVHVLVACSAKPCLPAL